MSVRYLPIAGVLVAALALSTPAFAGRPKGACRHHGCGAYRATQAFKAYVFRHTVPQGGSVASIGFASFGCRGAGERRYHCEVASETCAVTGVVVERKERTYSFHSVSSRGSCPKWRKTALTRTTPAPPSTATAGLAEALSATLIVHVHGCGGPLGGCRYYEDLALRITRLGPTGEALASIEPESHTVHVAPGVYEVAYLTERGGRPVQSTRVTVIAGQEQEVRLTMNVE